MKQEFNALKKVYINRDDKDNARDLLHDEEPFISHAPTAQLAAAEYISKYGDLLGIKSEETQSLGLTAEKDMIDAGGELRFYSEKRLFDTTTVTYQQTYLGLPVWHGAVSVFISRQA
jgi:zinc metalloprotease ZmpB